MGRGRVLPRHRHHSADLSLILLSTGLDFCLCGPSHPNPSFQIALIFREHTVDDVLGPSHEHL